MSIAFKYRDKHLYGELIGVQPGMPTFENALDLLRVLLHPLFQGCSDFPMFAAHHKCFILRNNINCTFYSIIFHTVLVLK